MMALEGVRDVEAKEGTTHSSECERRERGQHYQETGREGPGAVRLVVGRAVWVVRIVWIPCYPGLCVGTYVRLRRYLRRSWRP